MIDVKVGDRVYLMTGGGEKIEYALVLWVGNLPTEHVGANVGTFAGVQFDNPVGKGTGNLGPVQYFHAKSGHAAFVPASMLHKVSADSLSLFSSSFVPPTPSSVLPIGEQQQQQQQRRQLANISNNPSSASPRGNLDNHQIGAKSSGGGGVARPNPIGTSKQPPIGTPKSSSSSGAAAISGFTYAVTTSANSGAVAPKYNGATTTSAAGVPINNGAHIRRQEEEEEEEFFESDDDLDEALKVDDIEVSALAKMMTTTLSTPSSDLKGAASPDKKSKKKTQKTPNSNKNINNNNNVISQSSPARARTPSPPPAAPSSSTEWSVVASKIRKAPKQVQNQLKPAEKKATTPVKTKTKMEKILEENPKYKSTLCNWYMHGARCPNGDTCHFAHGESEMRVTSRPKFKYKTQVCSYYAAGHCGNGSACHFAHGLADLQKK